ncbi:hypothetical protein [Aurantivibrio plasticivorans]
MALLNIFAGNIAYKSIKENGLKPDQISGVFGASGAAKWLSIYGLDRAIYQDWLTESTHPIHLFGTSVGAWKFAAAAQKAPGIALDAFATAYIEQSYPDGFSHEAIRSETESILNAFLSENAVKEILSHPFFRFHCGAVTSNGFFASETKTILAAALGLAAARNLVSPRLLRKSFSRTIFSDPRDQFPLHKTITHNTKPIQLIESNFRQVIQASGSIPYVMPAVTNIEGAPNAVYRDGGLMDYHPAPGILWGGEGLILYPHFYSHIIPGWFDKPFRKRYATEALLSQTVLICPSADFIKTLPYERLPDRNDFKRFQKDDTLRIRAWREVAARSHALGEEFKTIHEQNAWRDVVQPIKNAAIQ